MIKTIIKRDGRKVPYEISKIQDAILMAATAVEGSANVKENIKLAEDTAKVVNEKLNETFTARRSPTVEQVQDIVEKSLISEGHAAVAKEYILYRAERNRTREMKADLMKIFEDLTFKDAEESDIKRENGNIDSDTAMGTMLKYGSEAAKEFNHLYLLDRDVSEAHKSGDIHIHDLDFYALTETCATEDTKIILKIGNNVFGTTFKFFNFYFKTDEKERVPLNKVQILSSDGKFVPILSCERRKLNENEKVYGLKTGINTIKLTGNHHVPIIRNGEEMLVQVKDIKLNDRLIRGSRYVGTLTELNLIDLMTPDNEFVILNTKYLKEVAHQYGFIQKLYKMLGLSSTYRYSKYFTLCEYKRIRSLFTDLIDEHDLVLNIKQGKSDGFPAILPLNMNLGKVMGYIYSEGYISFNKKDKRVYFTNSNDKYLEEYENCLKSVLPNITLRKEVKRNCFDYISNQGFYAYLFNGPLGVKKSSKEIDMPDWIYNANDNFLNGFFSALIDGDGNVSKNFDILTYNTACKSFRDNLHYLLLLKGIDSFKEIDKLKGTTYNISGKQGSRNSDSYKIRICSSNLDKLKDLNCFKIKENFQEKLRITTKTENQNNIKEIQDIKYASFVYDIETGDHYFNANGYLIHNCLQIPLDKLFEGGFSTGHGYLREPESIRSYGALTAIALQCNQNEMHGGQSIPALDYYLAPGVAKTYIAEICRVLDDKYDLEESKRKEIKSSLRSKLEELNYHIISDKGNKLIEDTLLQYDFNKEEIEKIRKKALNYTEKETYQSMEALVHNLNSMHSRAGRVCAV